jgi:hypothetical protein
VCYLARKAGLRAQTEKDDILVLGPPGQRADVVVEKTTPSGPTTPFQEMLITDVRTTNPCDVICCKKAAKVPGAANDFGTYLKTKSGKTKLRPKEIKSMALCVEAEGHLIVQFLKLIDYFVSMSGSTVKSSAKSP